MLGFFGELMQWREVQFVLSVKQLVQCIAAWLLFVFAELDLFTFIIII